MKYIISGILIALLLTLLSNTSVNAKDYLDRDEFLIVGGSSVALLGLGQWLRNFDADHKPLITGPILLDSKIQSWLGGRYYPGKTNFLDNTFGSAITGVSAGLILTGVNLTWPHGDKAKDASQDLFLFTSGIIATKGVTDIVKGIFARPRPYTYYTEISTDDMRKYRRSRHSFFSGHASSAFFATTFLNKRIRSIMRLELSSTDYKNWRWAPPTILFGWASFVGWSRLHAYKHHATDVIVGAAAGALLAELFYRLGQEKNKNAESSSGARYLFRISLSF